MFCLNFCRVQFLVLLLLCLVDVLSEPLLGPVPGFTPVIFGECVVCTLIGSSSSLVLLPLYLVDVFSDLCRVQFLVFLPLYLVDVLSELLLGPVPGFTPVIIGGCVV